MELVNIYYKGAGVTYQDYNPLDENLVISNYIFSSFGAPEDVIEYVVYDESGQFLDVNYSLTEYKPEADSVDSTTNTYSSLQLDPKADLVSLGYNRGLLNIQYNFLKNLFNSSYTENYWIKEISLSRTELKLSSQVISNDQIVNGFNAFQTYIANKNYFADFYLNFGQNRLIIANNVALYTEGEETFLLVKLYEPLPLDFDVKTTLWIVDKLAESVSFDVDTQVEAEPEAIQNSLRGPNFKVKVSDRIGQTTPYYTYDALFSSNLSSSMQQLASYYDDKAISINVDYTDFSNFIHFSSAVERINNFVYKLGLIESYQAELVESKTFVSMSSDTLYAVTQSNLLAQNNIDNIIKKFDTYEYYLYFSSESFAWPKSNSTKPYSLVSVTSSQALNWLGSEETLPTTNAVSILYSASYYDNTNQNKLSNAIPQYLLEDPNNAPYVTFIDMVGQHFDNIWLYYRDVSSRYDSSNNPNTGISMDLVADALRSMGLKLYTNTSVSDNLYYTLFGMNPDGSLLPPTGSEVIDTYVTSSVDTISSNDLEKETYKRIYHNLPYLLKTKGTQRGVKALISCYGIPESILSVNEFGGNNRYTGSGIYEINDEKINVISSSEHIQSNLLYPTTTLQKYNTDYRLNTIDIEVGFSPSDVINANFVSSSGFVSMDQLIGNPQYQTLNSYPALDEEKKTYFSTYTYPHGVWEYMRLVKYYNNSLFKMIKDFVPAKSNVSTGIIVKSHILERNKYARHEPSMSFDNNLSESIDLVTMSAGDAMEMSPSTAWSGNVMTPLGYASYSSSYEAEKYTGEFSGSEVFATDGQALDQTELSKNSSGLVQDIRINYGAIYQNVTASVRSTRFLDLDYSYNQSVPVNFGLITQSLSQSQNDNYNAYSNPYNPYAQLQDTNYATRAFTEPRYYGSKTYSKLYNTYTGPSSSFESASITYTYNRPDPSISGLVPYLIFLNVFGFITPRQPFIDPNIIGFQNIDVYLGGYGLIDPSNYVFDSNAGSILFDSDYASPYPTYITVVSNTVIDTSYGGDRSYGKTAAIDKNSTKIAWVKSFQSSSLNFYDKTSITLKYLIDQNENIVELNKRNLNLFDVQNIFKSGQNVIVSLSDLVNPSFQKTLDGQKKIFKGGFSYDPILFRENNDNLSFLYRSASLSSTIFSGYKGFDSNYITFGNNRSALIDMPEIGGNLRVNTVQNASSTPGFSVLVNNKDENTKPISTTSTFLNLSWNNGVAKNFNGIQINWGRSEYVSRTTDIFTADPSYVFLDSQGQSYWIGTIEGFTGTPGSAFRRFYNLGAESPGNTSRIFEIDTKNLFKLKFDDYKTESAYYEEQSDVRPNGVLFKTPRNSTYRFDMSMPFGISVRILKTISSYREGPGNTQTYVTPHHAHGVSLKTFFILEKSLDSGQTWSTIGHTRINNVQWSENASIDYDKDYSVLHIKKGQGSGIIQSQQETDPIIKTLTELKLYDIENNKPYVETFLEKDNLIRLRLFIIDLDNFLTYGRDLRVEFGKPKEDYDTISNSQQIPKEFFDQLLDPYFTVQDRLNPKIVYEQVITYSDNNIFTANKNVLTFTGSFNPFFTNETIFVPNEPTSRLYSPVIDNMSIQPLDIIRLGSFKNPQPEYFTVVSSSISYETAVSNGNSLTLASDDLYNLGGAVFIPNRLWDIDGDIEYLNTIVISPIANPTAFDFFTKVVTTNSKSFTISGAPTDLQSQLENRTFTIKGIRYVKTSIYNNQSWPYIPDYPSLEIAINETIPNTESGDYAPEFSFFIDYWLGGIKVTFTSSETIYTMTMNVILDRDIPNTITNISQNFAILRPKPDETSVIINHKKFDGEVSQAILIPDDVSIDLKNRVGDIFKNLNTDLSSTQQTII